jgi:photosystem II stability/assembly factor-like uncharacterized protein
VVVNGVVARTSDAGREWTQVWPSLVPTGPLAALSPTRALGAGDAVDPGIVMRTDDGGRHWSAVAQLPGDVTGLALSSDRYGQAAVLDVARDTWTLYATTSDGARWDELGALPQPYSPAEGYPGVTGLWTASPSRWLVLTVAGANVYDLSGIAPAELWATNDGGVHWSSSATVPLGPFGTTGAGAFVWQGRQWHGVVSAGTAAEATSDTGRHWTALPGAGGFAGATTVPGGFIATWSQTGNGGTELLASSDHGRRWRRADLPSGPVGLPFGAQRTLAFLNARDGWWDDGSAVFTTSDGGAHWAGR